LGALQAKISQDHDIVRSRLNGDAVGTAGDHTGALAAAVDRNRLGDRHGAERARIERVDFPARGGLGQRARKGRARRGAAARIGIAADTGNPGLRLCRRRPGGQ